MVACREHRGIRLVERTDADGGQEPNGVLAVERGLGQLLFDASFGHGATWQKQGEVAAAKITRNAAVLLCQAAQLLAERPQQIVALVPAVPFVEDLEMLDVLSLIHI